MNTKFLDAKAASMGLLHMMIAFTAMAVVTQVVGFSLQTALLFAGIGTIVFHFLTQHKLPVVMGVSAAYIGGILAVGESYGPEYVMGGIISAGVLYILFGLIMLKFQNKILPLFPDWLLSTVILLIGLYLIPVGVNLIGEQFVIGFSAFFATAIFDMFSKGNSKYFALPFGLAVGTLVALFTTGLAAPEQLVGFEFMTPKFNLSAFLTIGIISIPTMFEMLGDTKNTGDIIGKDVFKEVGIGRIALGNGIATIIGGLGGNNAYTTYSENAGFLLQTKYYNPHAQIWTGLFFMILAFATPVLNAIQSIPTAVFGGVILYLFSLITMNAVKQIGTSIHDEKTNPKAFQIISTMIASSFLTFIVGGVEVSSVAVATVLGVILHLSTSKFNKNT